MKSDKKDFKDCPFCGEQVEPDALQCESCRRIFSLTAIREQKQNFIRRNYNLLIFAGLFVLLIIIGATLLSGGKTKEQITQSPPDKIVIHKSADVKDEKADNQPDPHNGGKKELLNKAENELVQNDMSTEISEEAKESERKTDKQPDPEIKVPEKTATNNSHIISVYCQ